MRYVKLYIKTLLCCLLFGSIDTVGMDRGIDILELIEFAIGVLFIFFPIVLFISNRFFYKENNYTKLGKASINGYVIQKEVVAKYNPFILTYLLKGNVSIDKGLLLEMYYLLFNGYINVVEDQIVVTDKDKNNLKSYQQYIVDKIEKKDKIVLDEYKAMFKNDLKLMDIINGESRSNIVKGLFMMLLSPLATLIPHFIFLAVQAGPTALAVFIGMVVTINYFVEGFFLLFKKEIEYTDYGKSEMNKIMGFVTYMKSHDVFLKEDNPILYYDYLLYSYGICNSNLLLRDNDMKKIYTIIKKYIYEN